MSAPSTDNNTAVIDATTGTSLSDKNKKKKARTTFTGRQIFELEKQFEIKKSSSERSEMAKLLTVTETQVKIWFQNRRTKWKKQEGITNAEAAEHRVTTDKGKDEESKASRKAHKNELNLANGNSQAGTQISASGTSFSEDDALDLSSNISSASSNNVTSHHGTVCDSTAKESSDGSDAAANNSTTINSASHNTVHRLANKIRAQSLVGSSSNKSGVSDLTGKCSTVNATKAISVPAKSAVAVEAVAAMPRQPKNASVLDADGDMDADDNDDDSDESPAPLKIAEQDDDGVSSEMMVADDGDNEGSSYEIRNSTSAENTTINSISQQLRLQRTYTNNRVAKVFGQDKSDS